MELISQNKSKKKKKKRKKNSRDLIEEKIVDFLFYSGACFKRENS
jgi:hypothetical protein